jgi:hypothetical protein
MFFGGLYSGQDTGFSVAGSEYFCHGCPPVVNGFATRLLSVYIKKMSVPLQAKKGLAI